LGQKELAMGDIQDKRLGVRVAKMCGQLEIAACK
jgi:hypothetical protein